MRGTGYQSEMVTSLCLLSVQGGHQPEALGTMCSRDAHGLFEQCMIPMAFIWRSSALAEANLSGGQPTSLCMDRGACGLGKVLDTMLRV